MRKMSLAGVIGAGILAGAAYRLHMGWHGSLNMLGPGSGTIWRCILVGVSVSLWVWTFKTFILAPWKPFFSDLPSEQDVELSALPTSWYSSAMMIMD